MFCYICVTGRFDGGWWGFGWFWADLALEVPKWTVLRSIIG